MCGWRSTRAALVTGLILAGPLRAVSQTVTERARRYTGWLLTANVDSLWPVLSQEMREAANGRDGLVAFAKSIQQDAGRPTAVLTEFVVPVGPYQQYTERAQFDRTATVMVIQWSLDSNGIVSGALVRPEQPPVSSAYLDYRTKTPLRLPFDGRWLVLWGGRSTTENQHAIAPDQRYAYDLLVLDGGRTHRGAGARNEDYFCWGHPVLAPGTGTVAVARDETADNVPGIMNPASPPGNYVMIDHGNGEYSLVAHLQHGSVRVHAGERVTAGQLLGLCGNSGNASEPHVHYHLQTGSTFGAGQGLPAQFLRYRADGVQVERGEPRRGQVVEPE